MAARQPGSQTRPPRTRIGGVQSFGAPGPRGNSVTITERPSAYVPTARSASKTVEERVSQLWAAIARSPVGASLTVFVGGLLVALIASLMPVTAHTSDARGALEAKCGLGYYVLGSGNRAVDSACRAAYGSHAVTAGVIALALIVAIGLLVRVSASDLRHDTPVPGGELTSGAFLDFVQRTPSAAALATAMFCLGIGAIISLWPLQAATADSHGTIRAECGLGYFLSEPHNASVARACSSAYSSHGFAFFGLLAAVGALGLVIGTNYLRARRGSIRVATFHEGQTAPMTNEIPAVTTRPDQARLSISRGPSKAATFEDALHHELKPSQRGKAIQ